MNDDILNTIEQKMKKVISNLDSELTKISTGRPNPSIFNEVLVNYYGTPTPINQTSNIKIADANTILITPFDRNMTKDITTSISNSHLEFHPQDEGDKIRIKIPVLTEERRVKLTRKVSEEAENSKIFIRKIRQEYIKKTRNDDEISEDLEKKIEKDIQNLTDNFSLKIDNVCKIKSESLLKM